MHTRTFCFMLSVTIALSYSHLANGQAVADQRTKSLQEYLDHLYQHDKFMGTVAVLKSGEKILDHQVGFFEKDPGQVESDSQTQFRVGSISKTFTAVMILQLIEESELSLQTKLSEYFPEVKNANKITIEQMLRHRSGIGSLTDDPTYGRWYQETQSKTKMLERIADQPVRFAPDERTEYSNSNYVLLGFLIEELTGNGYADELRSRIVQRLDLKRTQYMTPADTKTNVARSFSRSINNWAPHPETDPSVPHGAGAIMSTASDLLTFIDGLFEGKLINSNSLKQMTTMVDGMGMGIMQAPFGGKKAFMHNGGIDGFRSSLCYFPEDKLAVALSGNGYNYNMNDIMIGVLSLSFGKEFELPNFDEVEISQDKLKRYEGVYSSAQFPLKLTVSVKDGKLTAQATGQGAFPLTATAETDFKFDAAGITMAFEQSAKDSDFDSLKFSQGGRTIKFSRE